ncbi:hypothetical protein H5123_07515 [Shewanella sp. SR43-4]|nr:hypothetical protein [Shewanella sp. SR43-4]RPA55881.1 hypothetical protein EGC79_04170 [Shewanella vesiculosa]UJL44639.1 hypothetical protein KDH10_002281 [Shewanella vesiculosa]
MVFNGKERTDVEAGCSSEG